ncbi:MAG: magnesium transporter [Oscillospiraceae bacterium]|jgi:magnesium transporter|nr:magnesium transporter [Oscillospiraceae bacterium]
MSINNLQDSIWEHLKNNNMIKLKQILNDENEYTVFDAIQNLPAKELVIVYRLLSKEKALDVFERLDTELQENLIHSFTDEAAVETIESMPPDDRVKLLDELPAAVAKKLLASLSQKEREMTNLLMGYEPETAGRIMTPEYVHLHKGITAAQALERVKVDAVEKETIYTIYITDGTRRLEGFISLRDLLIANPDDIIENIMTDSTITVSTDTDQEEVARLLQKLDWLAIPVVDKENRLVGIITVDDAIDILEDEATDDILDAAGFADIAIKEADRSWILTKGNLWKNWAIRLPFLLIALAGGLIAGVIIEGFEEMLESVVVVAFFIPVILDMGGSVGSQSTTVFARGVVLGHISIKNFLRPFLKEVAVGLSIGVILGVIAAIVILIWQSLPMLALTVGLALALTIGLASALGFLTPYIIIKLKGDQAAGSAPIITTVKDITGLFIYFVLVALLMKSYLYAEPSYDVTGMYATVDGIHYYIDTKEETASVLDRPDNNIETEIPEIIIVDNIEFIVTN